MAKFYGAKSQQKFGGVYVDNIVISKSVTTKNNSKYFIGYLDDAVRPLVLILPKTSGYIRTSKGKDGDKHKNKNNKLMPFHIDDDKLLECIKPIGMRLKICKILNYQFMMINI